MTTPCRGISVARTLSMLLPLACSVAVADGASAPPKDQPFHIVATDAGYEAPDRVPAGVRHIVYENHGKEIHEGMLVKLPAGRNADWYAAQVHAGILFPEGGLDYSGPGLTSPGQHTELWTRLDPGDYIVICWNDSKEKSHPVHPFTVTKEGAHDDKPPPEDVVLKLVDFRFELSGPIKPGTRVIRVDTVGPSMHEADLYRLEPGKSKADVIEWRKREGAGPAPAIALGGVLDSHDLSRTVWLKHEFVPGRYVLHCEMPMTTDAKSGTHYATHTDAGMVLEFEVAR